MLTQYNSPMNIIVDDSAIKRIEQIRQKQGKSIVLRITVDGGGCSGFQYKMELTDQIENEDEVFEDAVITDPISLPYLNGAIIAFKDDLIGSEFTIENPNAASGCGCGASFAV